MVDEMFKRVRAFIRREVAASSAEMAHPSQWDKGNVRLAWSEDLKSLETKERESRKYNVKVINMIRGEGSRKRPFEGERFGLTDELTFPAIPQNQLTDEPIILEGMIEGHQTKKMQNSASRFLKRLVPPSGNNRPSNNHGKGRKEQNEKLCGNVDSWKGCKVFGRRFGAAQKTWDKENTEDVFTISQERPNQHITTGTTLTANCKRLLTKVLQENIDVFSWAGSEIIAVPRFFMEHQLKIYPLVEPVVYKRRPLTPDERHTLKERVFIWLKERTRKKVQLREWVANTIPIKLENRTWKVQVDYSSLNKVYAKDTYPFLEEGEELASLLEYPYKCILFLPHAERIKKLGGDNLKDDGKGLDRSKRVKCGSIPRRNSGEKQKQTVHSSRQEGKFPGHMVTKEGVKADPEKVQTFIWSPTLTSPSQIQSLFLQLTTIGKFIPKLMELKYPINKVRMRMDVAADSGWKNEAEEALQRIKIKLDKLQTLAIPKEGEKLILCMRQRNRVISSILLVEREGIRSLISYMNRPLQGMNICYTHTEKMMQALIHTTRSLRIIFKKHKVAVITDGPVEEILKHSGREGRLAK
uniref:Reverse transcriptase/retrotransposon-derived protein RNase H-like domain-containing protein n=1 Tax=Tanacetum cinerariifolium TaxID=118510 RepID=A0A699JAI7_TANCI|nr:hypothetical protein [Tanacetum cinerariifolium]